MKTSTVTFLCLAFLQTLYGQVYLDGGQTRHRFAQLTVGLDHQIWSNNGTSSLISEDPGMLRRARMDVQQQTRLIIGGTHFWGHADFYLGIPLFKSNSEGLDPGVETGVRVYPWAIEKKHLTPYAGVSWIPVSYRQGEGAKLTWQDAALSLGASYRTGRIILDAGISRQMATRQDYYFSREDLSEIRTHRWRFGAGVKWVLETTMSAERDWQNGRTQMLTDTLAKLGRLNSWTVSAGPSVAIFQGRSDHNAANFPYLGQHRMSRVFPEIGVGYYWHRPDIQVNLSFRPVRSVIEAYGHRQLLSRNSLNLEAYHFLWDFHGFAPFIGPSIGFEWLSLQDQFTGQNAIRYEDTRIHPGLVFGWDIRPNRLQAFYLRTHLRWTPPLFLKGKEGDRIRFQSLEFNFIHAVIMIDRW